MLAILPALLVMLLAGCTHGGGANTGAAADAAAANDGFMSGTAESKAVVVQDQAAPTGAVPAGGGLPGGETFAPDTAGEDSPAGPEELAGSADPDGLSRKIVYKANMTMKVDDYAKAQTELQKRIASSGGYVLTFSDSKTASEVGGTYTVKVPASGFSDFMQQVEAIEHLDVQRSLSGTDVTQEYVDLQARLKAQQAVEARLNSFMEKAVKADDLLKISQQLGDVQTQIEQIKGRMRYLDQNVAYSTAVIKLYEELEPVQQPKKKGKETALGERLTNALSGSADFLYRMLQGALVLAAGAIPVLAVLAVVCIPFYFGWRRRRKRRDETREAGPANAAVLPIHIPSAENSDPADPSEAKPKKND